VNPAPLGPDYRSLSTSCRIPSWNTGRTRGTTVSRPRKYHTQEERREAVRQSQRKYYNANREAISAKRAKAYKRKRAAMKVAQKET